MIIDGKYVELRTSAHFGAAPSKLWKIDYCNGVANSIVVEAETEDEAKKIGLAEYRKNSEFSSWDKEFIVKSAVCIQDSNEGIA